jgi:hypothetical protein
MEQQGGNMRRRGIAGLEPPSFKEVASIAAYFETFKNKEQPRKYPG